MSKRENKQLQTLHKIQIKSQHKPGSNLKKEMIQPEWNSSIIDSDQYRLSKEQQMRRKLLMKSNNEVKAREEWKQRQDKLKRGDMDEELRSLTNVIQKAPVKTLKPKRVVYNNKENQKKKEPTSEKIMVIPEQLEQLEPMPQGNILKEISNCLVNTREFVKSIETCSVRNHLDDPERMLSKLSKLEWNVQQQRKSQPKIQQEQVSVDKSQCLKEQVDKIQDTIKYLEENFVKDEKSMMQKEEKQQNQLSQFEEEGDSYDYQPYKPKFSSNQKQEIQIQKKLSFNNNEEDEEHQQQQQQISFAISSNGSSESKQNIQVHDQLNIENFGFDELCKQVFGCSQSTENYQSQLGPKGEQKIMESSQMEIEQEPVSIIDQLESCDNCEEQETEMLERLKNLLNNTRDDLEKMQFQQQYAGDNIGIVSFPNSVISRSKKQNCTNDDVVIKINETFKQQFETTLKNQKLLNQRNNHLNCQNFSKNKEVDQEEKPRNLLIEQTNVF